MNKAHVISTYKILKQKAFNEDIDEGWINWAIEMMEAGFESDNLYILAGMTKPFNQFELQELTDRVLKDLKLSYSDKEKVSSASKHNLLCSGEHKIRPSRRISCRSVSCQNPAKMPAVYEKSRYSYISLYRHWALNRAIRGCRCIQKKLLQKMCLFKVNQPLTDTLNRSHQDNEEEMFHTYKELIVVYKFYYM